MIRAYYQLFLHDKNGKLVWKSRKRKSKSFVLQWLQSVFVQLRQGSIDIKAQNGTLYSRSNSAQNPNANAGTGMIYHGIQVGTGTTPESNSDYMLASRISHGTGAGQLQYGSMGFTDPAIIAGNVDGVLTRAFVNGSGATITVNEISVAVFHVAGTATDSGCSLVIRDVLPAGVNVPNGQTLTVQYTLRTTV